MARWRNKAIQNLLKNSTEKEDHSIAAKEWEFAGDIIDHYVSNHTCQLCEGENLRYHFKIINKSLNNTLLVGSSCIKKFDIPVFNENGIEIFGNKKASFLHKKIEEKIQELMLESIRDLWRISTPEEKDDIEYYVYEYKGNKGFRPDDLCDLFAIMKRHDIEYNPALFKVSLRSQIDMRSLIYMHEPDRNNILSCLTVQQKKRYAEKKKHLEKKDEEHSSVDKIRSGNVIRKDVRTFSEIHNEDLQLHSRSDDNLPEKPERKNNQLFYPPDYVTCSICGKYTKEWVVLNPNKCRKCLDKLHREKGGIFKDLS